MTPPRNHHHSNTFPNLNFNDPTYLQIIALQGQIAEREMIIARLEDEQMMAHSQLTLLTQHFPRGMFAFADRPRREARPDTLARMIEDAAVIEARRGSKKPAEEESSSSDESEEPPKEVVAASSSKGKAKSKRKGKGKAKVVEEEEEEVD